MTAKVVLKLAGRNETLAMVFLLSEAVIAKLNAGRIVHCRKLLRLTQRQRSAKNKSQARPGFHCYDDAR
jgi:hypothetical protein